MNGIGDKYIDSLVLELKSHSVSEIEIARCISYATKLRENKLPVIFDRDHLAHLLRLRPAELSHLIHNQDSHYSIFKLPKRKSGYREISAPSPILKQIQRWILDNILQNMKVSNCAFGFIPGRSIVDNASKHINQDSIVNVDLKDFFLSVKFQTIFRIFFYYGYSKEVSFYLSRLCTYHDSLPQGAPSSPYFSNIALLKVDKRLEFLAKKFSATYTRYADDITFSGKGNLGNIVPIVGNILKEEGYSINDGKTRIAFKHQRQEVTGLLVNDQAVRIPKPFKRGLFQEIYYCQKYGVNSHMKHKGITKMFYKEHLYGKAYYILMVEPKIGIRALNALDSLDWTY